MLAYPSLDTIFAKDNLALLPPPAAHTTLCWFYTTPVGSRTSAHEKSAVFHLNCELIDPVEELDSIPNVVAQHTLKAPVNKYSLFARLSSTP